MDQKTPQVGKKLPDFSMPAVIPGADGSIAETTVTPKNLHGRPLVLFFYPRDATPGCTVEVCSFRDAYKEFEKIGVTVLGVSRDTVKSHIKFIQNQGLPYGLAADKDAELIKAWGLLVNKTMYGKPVTGVARTTYVVDSEGTVRHIFEKVTPLGHAAQVLDIVRTLK